MRTRTKRQDSQCLQDNRPFRLDIQTDFHLWPHTVLLVQKLALSLKTLLYMLDCSLTMFPHSRCLVGTSLRPARTSLYLHFLQHMGRRLRLLVEKL